MKAAIYLGKEHIAVGELSDVEPARNVTIRF